MKSLVAYFSRAGGNYAGGNIVNLNKGNTEIIANKIKELTGSDIFQIRTINPYPDDYRKTVEIAREEIFLSKSCNLGYLLYISCFLFSASNS